MLKHCMARDKVDVQIACTDVDEVIRVMTRPPPPPKRRRTDVALRHAVNKVTTFSVVKTTWNSFCRPAPWWAAKSGFQSW